MKWSRVFVLILALAVVAWFVHLPFGPVRGIARGLKYAECAMWQANGKEGLRLVGFGDSLTGGGGEWGFLGERSWYSHMVCDDNFVAAGNLAVSGDTTSDMLARLQEVDAADPDVLVVTAGLNDLKEGINPEVSAENIDSILRYGSEHAELVMVATTLPWPETDATALNEAIRKSAEENNSILLPFDQILASDSSIRFDESHPNRAGAVALAEYIESVIEEHWK